MTGRDGYIVAQALLRFIATEQVKPKHHRQWSNEQDAIAIFNANFAGLVDYFSDEYQDSGLPLPSLIDEKAPRTAHPVA